MRRLLVASVLAAGLAGSLAMSVPPQPVGHSNTKLVARRKTMGFGPDHPHAVFRSDVPQALQPLSFSREPADPVDIAKQFVKTLIPDTSLQGDSVTSFYVRPDSYTDRNTGIAHIYLRQVVYGIEVADGDVNVNVDVESGRVLSYGSSVGVTVSFFVRHLIYNSADPFTIVRVSTVHGFPQRQCPRSPLCQFRQGIQ